MKQNNKTKKELQDENAELRKQLKEYQDSTISDVFLKKEKEFQSIIQTSFDGFWVCDLKGKFLVVNNSFCEILGYNEAELLSMSVSDIEVIENPEDTARHIKKLVETGGDRFETKHRRKDGNILDIAINASYTAEDGGKIFVFNTDITDKKRAEILILENKARYKTLTESSQDHIFIIDNEFRVSFINNRASVAFHSAPEKLIGRHINEIFPPKIAESQINSLKHVLRTGEKLSSISESAFPGGSVWLDTSLVPINDKTGKAVSVMGVSRDVTTQKMAEIELRKSEEKFRNLFNAVSIPLCYVKEDGTIESFNNRFTKLLGYTKEDIPTLNEWWITAYPDEEYRTWVVDNWNKAVQASIEKEIDIKSDTYNVTCKNGELRQIIIAGITVGKDFLATFLDVTEQRRAEDTIKREKDFSDSVIDALPGIFYLFDQNGKFVRWNTALSELSGVPYNEIGEKSPLDFIEESGRSKVEIAIKTAFKEGIVYVEANFISKSNKQIPFYFTGRRIIFNGVVHLLGVGIDITERKRAISALIESEHRLSRAIEDSPFPIMIHARGGAIIQLSKSWTDITGYHISEISTINKWCKAAYGMNNAEVKKVIGTLYDIESSTNEGEFEIICKNGEKLIWDFSSTRIGELPDGRKLVMSMANDITHRKKMEETLKRSEAGMKTILDSMPFGTMIVGKDKRIRSLNNSALELIGYSSLEEIKGRYCHDTLCPADKGECPVLDHHMSVDKSERILLTKDGIEIPILKSVIPITLGNEEVLLETFVDISNLKRLQEENEKAFEERDRFFKVSLDLLCVAGTDGYFRQMNPAWSELLGWSIEELKAKPFFEFIHPDEIDATLKEVEKLATGVQTIRFTNRYRCKNGTYKWLTWNTAPFDDVLYAVATDITDLKNAQNKVTELLGRLNLALEGGNVGVWEWDLATDETIWDIRMESMFGLDPGTFNGTFDAFKKGLHPDDIGITLEAIEKALSGEKSYDIVYRSKWESGEIRFINAKAIVIKDKDGNPEKMIGVCLDVTEIKDAEQQLKRITEDLKRSNEELEQFAYVASHDLQEPLRMVASFTQLLEKRYKDQLDEKANKYIFYAVDGAKRMQLLINDLLDFSRITTKGDDFSAISCETAYESAIESLRLLIEETGAKITHDHLPEILADKTQIVRIFQNLISNSLKFRNTSIKPEIHISVKDNGGLWQFSIRDNGIGIPVEFKEKVFVIFQRLHGKDKYAGTGIGLSVCKRIVNRHGGEIWFDSVAGEGTTFYFTIKK